MFIVLFNICYTVVPGLLTGQMMVYSEMAGICSLSEPVLAEEAAEPYDDAMNVINAS